MQQQDLFPTFAADLRRFMTDSLQGAGAGSSDLDDRFNSLALRLFDLQVAYCEPYRRFSKGARPRCWREIPAVPAAGFKDLELTCLPPEARTNVFFSSGTTAQKPSRHFHSAQSLRLYESSLWPWFKSHLGGLPGELAILTPPPEQVPNSSLVHMMDFIRSQFGKGPEVFHAQCGPDTTWRIDGQALLTLFRQAEASHKPLLLLGTAFSFVHLLDEISNAALHLPAGSRIMETGGYKGRSRVLAKSDLHAKIHENLGIPRDSIVSEYGMSELSSQAYDLVAGSKQPRSFRFPPWARAQITSPETNQEVAEGETGLVRILDLANAFSIAHIQTEDLGRRRVGGFELLGRAVMSEPRGCSLALR